MTNPVVYLATPIDQAKGVIARHTAHWRNGILQVLMGSGFTVYDPRGAWNRVDGQVDVQKVNDAAIASADGMVAALPTGMPTIGVPMEIERARALDKPVVVIGGEEAAFSVVLAHRHIPVYDRAADAAKWLADAMATRAGIRGEESADEHEDSSTLAYLDAVKMEVERAQRVFPASDSNPRHRWFTITIEEVLEVALALTQAWNDAATGKATREDVLSEAVQTGAMAARLWEAMQKGADDGT